MAATALVARHHLGVRLPPSLAAVLMVVAGVGVAVDQVRVRALEAWLSAGLAKGLDVVQAEPFGSAVVFPLDGRQVGFSITPGCSVAFLLPFFFVVAAALLAFERITPRRSVVTIVAVSAVLFAVNQVRLLIVSASMQGWGFETGYERSHILLGTLASTIGVVLGVFLFLYLVTRPSRSASGLG